MDVEPWGASRELQAGGAALPGCDVWRVVYGRFQGGQVGMGVERTHSGWWSGRRIRCLVGRHHVMFSLRAVERVNS